MLVCARPCFMCAWFAVFPGTRLDIFNLARESSMLDHDALTETLLTNLVITALEQLQFEPVRARLGTAVMSLNR